MTTTFTADTASAALSSLLKEGEAWAPIADGRAYIVSAAGERRIAHRHYCLVCETVVGWSDDCEGDYDHPFELCDDHVDVEI